MSHIGVPWRLRKMLMKKSSRLHYSYSLSESAANRLDSPALGIMDMARFPEHDGSNYPGPKELPKHGGPPNLS